MSISLGNIFDSVKECVTALNQIEALFTAVNTLKTNLREDLELHGADSCIYPIEQQFLSFSALLENTPDNIRAIVQARLTDNETVLEQLYLSSSDFSQVMERIIQTMLEESETVDANTVTVGSITFTRPSAKTGSLIVTKKMSGNQNVAFGWPVISSYSGLDCEFTFPDTFNVVCTEASQGTDPGTETFAIYTREPKQIAGYQLNPGGNVSNQEISPARLQSLIPNFFDTFVSNLPTGWTGTGTAGTNYGSEATVKMFDTNSAFLNGTGALQYPIFTVLEPNETYVIGCYVRKVSGATGTVTLTAEIKGATVGSVTLNAATEISATDWTLVHIVVNTESVIGAANNCFVRISSSSLTQKVFIDGGFMISPTYVGGLGFVLSEGVDQFVEGDKFTFDVTNNQAGKIQTMFNRLFRYQLPSNNAGAETITDPS